MVIVQQWEENSYFYSGFQTTLILYNTISLIQLLSNYIALQGQKLSICMCTGSVVEWYQSWIVNREVQGSNHSSRIAGSTDSPFFFVVPRLSNCLKKNFKS